MAKKKAAKKRSGSKKKAVRAAPKRGAKKKVARKSSPKKAAPKKKTQARKARAPKPAYKSSFKQKKKSVQSKSFAEPSVKLEIEKVEKKTVQNIHHFTAHLFLLCALVGFVFAVTFAFTQDWLLFFLALLIMIIGLDNMALGLRKHKESMLR